MLLLLLLLPLPPLLLIMLLAKERVTSVEGKCEGVENEVDDELDDELRTEGWRARVCIGNAEDALMSAVASISRVLLRLASLQSSSHDEI